MTGFWRGFGFYELGEVFLYVVVPIAIWVAWAWYNDGAYHW